MFQTGRTHFYETVLVSCTAGAWYGNYSWGKKSCSSAAATCCSFFPPLDVVRSLTEACHSYLSASSLRPGGSCRSAAAQLLFISPLWGQWNVPRQTVQTREKSVDLTFKQTGLYWRVQANPDSSLFLKFAFHGNGSPEVFLRTPDSENCTTSGTLRTAPPQELSELHHLKTSPHIETFLEPLQHLQPSGRMAVVFSALWLQVYLWNAAAALTRQAAAWLQHAILHYPVHRSLHGIAF
ncbi:hypothetical protein Q8A73_017304 [Channa argus]|nr:hypothetical protein Q8A73_017304 [Channa argus]